MTRLPSAVSPLPLLLVAAALPLLLLIPAAPGAAQGQPDPAKVQFANVNRELVARLAAVDRLVADQQWYEAVDGYQALLRDNGDELVPTLASEEPLASTHRVLQARWLIHARLARLPAPALKIYRDRVDAAARKWLEVSVAERDAGGLVRVAEEALCSKPAEQALEHLGDLAFERGHFDEAQQWWRLLAVPASQAESAAGAVLFPDPAPATVARVRAKQIVTLLFQHQADRVPTELKAYRQAHGKAVGTLAGKSGLYADTVEALARQGQGAPVPAEQEWPTFAGCPSRQGAVAFPLPQRLWSAGPAWRVDLVSGELVPESVATKSPDLKQVSPRVFPIVAHGRAYVSSSRWVRGFDLHTGRLSFRFDLEDVQKIPDTLEPNLKSDVAPAARFSLTAVDDHVYARLGAAYLGPAKDGQKAECGSWLVCLRPADADAPLLPKRAQGQVWSVAAGAKDEDGWLFEGAPLVHDGGVYIAQSRTAGGLTRTVLCCFDAATGAARWHQELCAAREFDENTPGRHRHHLLTLTGRYVVYATHAGAVVAVDAQSGKIAWAVRYPSRGPRTRDNTPSPRDLCPAVACAGRVLVAPADAARLYCFDGFTGRNLWEREAVEVVHLLGVAHGRAVFTTPTGLRAVGVEDGADMCGWCQPAAGSLGGNGRGLLAGSWVFWPTQDGKMPFRALNLLGGGQSKGIDVYDPGQLWHLSPGNLAFGHGCLVVATAEELLGYVPPQGPVAPPQT
jgi:outer membrane protein assembly factor BamB